MVNICECYTEIWAICFNRPPCESYCITFGGSCTGSISLNNTVLKRVSKLKYLGCYFHEQTCSIDFSHGLCTYYGNFNNVMSVVGCKRNETVSLHLIRTIVYQPSFTAVKRGI